MLRTLQESTINSNLNILINQAPIFLADPENQIEINNKDLEQCKQLIDVLINCQSTLSEKLDKMKEKVQQRTYNKGIGYFNAKNLMFLEYLIQLQFYELFKINSIDLSKETGLQLYKRLVYLKTLFLKLSPVQKKLEYQKNKLLKLSDLISIKNDQPNKKIKQSDDINNQQLAQSEKSNNDEEQQIEQEDSQQDGLVYQPRPQALVAVKQKKDDLAIKSGKYIAPKISATLSKQDKIKRRQERQEERRKVHLIRKYRDDLIQDDDARQQGVDNQINQKIKKKFRQKISIEEANFVRFPQSKKDRFWKKQQIQKHNKTDQLKDALKQVQMVGKIYRSQVQEDLNEPLYKSKEKSLTKYESKGKKQKRQ